MNEKLKEVLNQVQAEEELKQKTKAFIIQKTSGYTRTKTANYRRLIPAVACLVLLIFGGYWLYFTPTVEISIDINPSMQLGINRFDRVISVKSYNNDAQKLIDSLDIKYMNYSDAVNQIMENASIATLLSNDEIMTIAVIGTDGTQSSEILAAIQSYTAGEKNICCYYTQAEEVDAAHELGLSYGKYRAFLEVQALDPDITAGEIQGMTMREIRDLIARLSDGEDETGGFGNNKGYGHQGNGNGNGQGHGYGHGRDTGA